MNVNVVVTKLTSVDLLRAVASVTMPGPLKTTSITLSDAYARGHSIIRSQIFYIRMHDVQAFVSSHFARHKHVEHFIQSNRNDKNGSEQAADRQTLIRHDMLINAESLISMSGKRLCGKSHVDTVRTMRTICTEIRKIDPDLYEYLVPQCIYRNGWCPEEAGGGRQCEAGLSAMTRAYR
jgi:hypothetical protein